MLCVVQNPHCQLTNSPMDRQRLLMNPINNGRQSLKKQRSQQHHMRQPPIADDYYQQSPPHAQQGYMLNNGAVVYADLALNHQRARPYLAQHVPLPVYHSRPHTEYAVIKFHDVGQEIDVWGWFSSTVHPNSIYTHKYIYIYIITSNMCIVTNILLNNKFLY